MQSEKAGADMMQVEKRELQSPRSEFWSKLQRGWNAIATVLALISLVNLTSDLIQWTTIIQSIAERQAVTWTRVLSWLPFYIPPALYDPVLPVCILFSVTSIGFNNRTGGYAIGAILASMSAIILLQLLLLVLPLLLVPPSSQEYLAFGVGAFALMAICLAVGIAWRWIIVTVAIFIALITVNYLYMLMIVP